MPKHKLICNTINLYRRLGRPAHMEVLIFILNHYHIPEGFFRENFRVNDKRHLIFMSKHQIQILKSAKIYGLECKKQIIDAHIFMSRHTASDYEAVFRSIKSTVGDVAVERVVSYFEKEASTSGI